MAYAALISLYRTMADLDDSSHISLSPTSKLILISAIKAAKSLRMAIKRLDQTSKSYSRKNVNALDERIKAAVWRFEDLLDSHVYHQIFPQSQILRGVEVHLDEIKHDIETFAKKMKEFKVEYMYELDHLSPEEEVDVAVVSSAKKSKMVGSSYMCTFMRCFIGKGTLDHLSPEEEVDVAVVSSATDSGVKNCKIVGSQNRYILWNIRSALEMKHALDVRFLVGMAGIGKTALAKKIFFDDELQFECRAWVTIGRKWEPKKLKRDILIQLDLSKGDARILKTKRCLIVLDDVWDKDVWNHFKRSFPKHIFGSTLVLLTTRIWHVANATTRLWHGANAVIPSTWYEMKLLNDDESWDLLRQRVFGEEGECPPELEKAGKKIAEECDGLPLMIVTIAELLLEAEMSVECWESIAKKKNSPIFMIAYDRLYEVLFPSYEYLPQHLKPCFLYMGLFTQCEEIERSWILDMWIAEGFLLSSFSDIYFGGLHDHSVIIICQNRSFHYLTEKENLCAIKSCRLQSSFWHLCKREATNTKFSHILTTLDDVEESIINTQRRLSFLNNILLAFNNVSNFVGDVCASTARSLQFNGPEHPYPVPICFNLRLLKVLDANVIRFYEFPMLVFQLVYLRLLALTYDGKLPASISKLWNLQFLFIRTHMRIRYSGVTSYMPIDIWEMKKLRGLRLVGRNLPNPSSGASMESLLKLNWVGVETCTKEVLERIPNLKKLGIQVDLHPGDDDGMKALHCLNHVHVLRKLTSLTCEVWNPILRSEILSLPAPLPMLPSSLKKLHLDGTGYPWSYMRVIGSLPHLQVLKLGSYAFRGSEWVVKDGEFQTLNVLMIGGTDLVRFKVEVGGFPGLREVFFSNCYKLRDLQWELDQNSSVIITVEDCSTPTVAFANECNSTRESHIPEEHRVKYVTSSYMK